MVIRPNSSDSFIQKELELYSPFFMALTMDDIVFDIGANIGLVTCEMADSVAIIFAFEPHPINFAILQNNIAKKLQELGDKCANIVAIDCAITAPLISSSIAHSHKTVLHARLGENQGAHTINEPRSDRHHIGIEVKTMPIQLILGSAIKPTAIKLDIEGAEELIMPHLFSCDSIKTILVELHPKAWEHGSSILKFEDIAADAGFKRQLLEVDLIYGTSLILFTRCNV